MYSGTDSLWYHASHSELGERICALVCFWNIECVLFLCWRLEHWKTSLSFSALRRWSSFRRMRPVCSRRTPATRQTTSSGARVRSWRRGGAFWRRAMGVVRVCSTPATSSASSAWCVTSCCGWRTSSASSRLRRNPGEGVSVCVCLCVRLCVY